MADALARIDAALLDMRRLWAPTTSGRAARGQTGAVDLSTVLVVHTVGGAEGGLSVADVAEQLGVAPATASRLCDRAAAAGVVHKAAAVGDARRVAVTITDAGVRLRDESFAFREHYLSGILVGWSASDIDTFQRLLTRFADAVHARPPTPPTRDADTPGESP